ncbi:MAG: ATP-binding cassette domain-containing protein [Spirochaetaceae bacterium]|nr:MAG: ATP-binding cassette domain-containing protein [Spirochaetaceae bacterium]
MNDSTATTAAAPLLEVRDLVKHFVVKRSFVGRPLTTLRAVDGVSFTVNRGETLGIVGESGCGKTTVGRTVIRLYEPNSGSIVYDGTDLAPLTFEQMRPFRRRLQMIFQDPYASLNPRMTVTDIITEGVRDELRPADRKDLAKRMLETVGLNDDHANRYPHEFSGGQRQRIGIARALAMEPDMIICDEPISALDVSIQAQVVNMLEELQQKLGLTLVFIAHDLSMVKHISSRIAVMYLGRIVETGSSYELFARPYHPYTKALLSAMPIPDPDVARANRRIILKGDVPSPTRVPSGCRFRTRCPYAMKVCSEQEPEFREVAPGRFSACHLEDGAPV